MADLILGPVLRYVSETEATVWVEADMPCEVEILGHRAPTFHVADHHYALVVVEGLAPGESREYTVALDGEQRWPLPGSNWPASRISTLGPGRSVKVAFGSCRVAAPQEPPYVLERSEDRLGLGVDALAALAHRVRSQRSDDWPSLLLMLGDQIYADHVSPETRAFIRSRRTTTEPPGEEVADFEEYTRLYREAWTEPAIRWLLSTIPSAMIFDDHEVIDDWNISAAWKAEIQTQPWWPERIAGAFMSYWLYQHLGNLSPHDLDRDEMFKRVRAADDAGPLLREFGLKADRTTAGTRWSFSRPLGGSRLVVVDSRAGRLLRDGRREMVDDEEWQWLEGQLQGGVDHLLVATSLPFLLPQAIHDFEAWSEAVCAGKWGAAMARLGERVRLVLDLEHWAAFQSSFHRLAHVLADVAAGGRGPAPASIVLLSGDVHYAYLAEATFRGQPVQTRIFQAVCSPFRHPLDPPLQLASRMAFRRPMAWIGAVLARAARVGKPPMTWRIDYGPYFENEVAMLALRGREAFISLERTPPREIRLECVVQARLASAAGPGPRDAGSANGGGN